MSTMKNIQKLILNLMMIGLVAGLTVLNPITSYAQEVTPTPEEGLTEVIAVEAEDEYSFTELGFAEETINGPFGATRLRFAVPPNWELTVGAEIQLDLAFFYSLPDRTDLVYETEVFGGLLRVVFNDVTLASVLLDERGERTVSIPITAEALAPARDDGQHELELQLISDESCLYGIDVVVVVHQTSRFILPHRVVAVETDLAQLPLPIYQPGLIVPNSATFVVPDTPSRGELRAALMVAAGFGRMSGEELLVQLVKASDLTPELRALTHLVYIGKPSGLPDLSSLPLLVAADSFTSGAGSPEDGILQLAASPWNEGKAVLVVSGDTDEGVVKAAQVLSSGFVLGTEGPTVSRIASVSPTQVTTIAAANRTLADLGYPTATTTRFGVVISDFDFYVPYGFIPEGDSYFDLVFAHSTLVDYQESGVAVELNGEPVATSRISEETAGYATLRVDIPDNLVRGGENRLSVRFGLIPQDTCAEFLVDNIWFTIFDESLLHLPLIPAPIETGTRFLDLDFYPDFLSLSPASGSVAFVVPQGDSGAWQVAADIAANVGDDTNWNVAESELYFADNVPDDVRQNHDLVLIGRASVLPIISELSGVLPASFEAGSDIATVQDLQVTYRLPAWVDLGYLELLESPWNTERAILAVLGSTDVGVISAGNTLATPELRGGLAGDFALINGEQVLSLDTRLDLSAGTSAIATAVPETEVEAPVFEPAPEVVSRPEWVLPAIAGVVILMVLVILVAGISALRNRN